MTEESETAKHPLKLFKTSAYAIITVSSITAFGLASRAYGSNVVVNDREISASIAFAVLAAAVSAFLLVLWLSKEEVAQKVCLGAAHATLVFVAVALGTAAGNALHLTNFALYTATIVALLLCVHHWNNLNLKITSQGNGNDNEPRNSQLSANVRVVSPPA